MCKYCDFVKDTRSYAEPTDMIGEDICDGKYEACKMIGRDDQYYIQLIGSYETLSDPISWCPFCGRRLYVED